MSTKTRLKKLYRFRDLVNYEMLGQTDAEYRGILEHAKIRANEEIAICLERIENNLP